MLRLLFCGLLALAAALGLPTRLPAQSAPNPHPNDVLRGRGPFTAADSLRGSLSPLRSSYDVRHYDLHLRIDIPQRHIAGYVDIRATALAPITRLQIDLFEHYAVDSVTLRGSKQLVAVERNGNALFLTLPRPQPKGRDFTLRVHYQGQPPVARNPPWDGGFVWRSDPNGLPWVGVACEGFGSSSWWPCKDYLGDEPDSAAMHFTIADPRLRVVSNGQNRGTTVHADSSRTYHWAVSYPINLYNVTLNIGDYVTLRDTLRYPDGQVLPLSYYVLASSRAAAVPYLSAQVKPMLRCYAQYVGHYPYPRDGYALVQTDYFGMEHQGAIAYGNGFGSDPRRFDYGGWDYIIVHETGHEWFGNRISVADHADMWIHESWTTYLEVLYEECLRGKEASVRYLNTRRGLIENVAAMQGPPGVNFEDWPDGDMYFKGAWMLHTLRQYVGDEAFLRMLRQLPKAIGQQPTSTAAFTATVDRLLGGNYQWFWDAYLNYARPPVLHYTATAVPGGTRLQYEWRTGAREFRLPVDLLLPGGRRGRIEPVAGQSKQTVLKGVAPADIRFDTNRGYFQVRTP